MTIVRVRGNPGGTDQYGDPVTSTDDRLTLDSAFTAPRSSDDVDGRGRTGIVVGLTLFAPYDADIIASDRIEVDGVLYDIEGDAGRWESPFTQWQAGLTVALSRAAG